MHIVHLTPKKWVPFGCQMRDFYKLKFGFGANVISAIPTPSR